MRVAIVSDIHGNFTALQAVLSDLAQLSPDLILQGGDLAGPGSRPVEVVDQIRDLGWQGVLGNTDEMLPRPASLAAFAALVPKLKPMFDAIGEMAAWMRDELGAERLAWHDRLPMVRVQDSLALVHASPDSTWRSPAADATDEEMTRVYGSMGSPLVVYGHIHRPFVRRVGDLTVANSGTVGMSYDGDPRASYLLVDHGRTEIRRVEYDVDAEVSALLTSRMPHAEWAARSLRTAGPVPL